MERQMVKFTYYAKSDPEETKNVCLDERIESKFTPCSSMVFVAPEGATAEQVEKLVICIFGEHLFKMRVVNPEITLAEKRFSSKCFAFYTFGDELTSRYGFSLADVDDLEGGEVKNFVMFDKEDESDFMKTSYAKTYKPWFKPAGIVPAKTYKEFKDILAKLEAEERA